MGIDIIEVIKKDEKLKGIIEELKANKTISKDEAYKKITAYLASKDINVTKEDIDSLLQNNSKVVLNNKMSDQELDSINGGFVGESRDEYRCDGTEAYCRYSANFDWYSVPGCSATVEFKSWCHSDDQCAIWDVTYDWVKK